jgi:hypothetical protein
MKISLAFVGAEVSATDSENKVYAKSSYEIIKSISYKKQMKFLLDLGNNI